MNRITTPLSGCEVAMRDPSRLAYHILWCLLCLIADSLHAQTSSASRYYYAIENLDTAQIVRRGQTTVSGIPANDLILAPDTNYREWLFQSDTGYIGHTDFRTPPSGQRFVIPPVRLGLPLSPDTDGDGLTDDAERIVNSNPTNKFSFLPGVMDGAAVRLGLIDQSGSFTGVLGSVDTPGTAVDICAFNDIVVMADSASGVTVFNVFNRMIPIIIAQLNTPGSATAVACSGNYIAVADGTAGLAIIDITDPNRAAIRSQINLGGTAQAVTTAGDVAFVGTVEGNLVVVDMVSGTTIQQLSLGRVEDLAVAGDRLYTYANNQLKVLTNAASVWAVAGSVNSPSPIGINAANGRGRMFVGGDIAYLVHARGYNTFSVTNAAQPTLLLQGVATPAQFGWKAMALNGSGLALVASSANQAFDGVHNVSLYSITNPAVFGTFQTSFNNPGIARAVALYNGFCYVATHADGLQVISYQPLDLNGVAPTISLQTSFTRTSPTNGVVEEGHPVSITAMVSDDAQVRNVEFYLDGVKVATDGNFPFEHHFTSPPRGPNKTSFRLRARASDTGGNFKFTDEIVVQLLVDTTPPLLTRSSPPVNGIVTVMTNLFVGFNKPLDPATINSDTVQVISAGPDYKFGTADDVRVTNATFSFNASINGAFLVFPAPLPTGQYRLRIGGTITDLAGNRIGTVPDRPFWVLPDGPNGDPDDDGLTSAQEIALGTNPLLQDTDGDGWDDGVEVMDGTNPLDPNSQPRKFVSAAPPVEVFLESDAYVGNLGGVEKRLTVAYPPVEVFTESDAFVGNLGGVEKGFTVARPPVEVFLDSDAFVGNLGGVEKPFTVANPPVEIFTESDAFVGNLGGVEKGFTVARPPVEVFLDSDAFVGNLGGVEKPFTAANPPVEVFTESDAFVGNLLGLEKGITMAYPPLEIYLLSTNDVGTAGAPFTLALPPVQIQITTNAPPAPPGVKTSSFKQRNSPVP